MNPEWDKAMQAVHIFGKISITQGRWCSISKTAQLLAKGMPPWPVRLSQLFFFFLSLQTRCKSPWTVSTRPALIFQIQASVTCFYYNFTPAFQTSYPVFLPLPRASP